MHAQAAKVNTDGPVMLARRRMLIGSVALIGATVIAVPAAFANAPGVTSVPGGSKPTFVPDAGSSDPRAHSVAENLFWCEQMMEHALFFTMLMPGERLAKPRQEADAFRTSFAAHLAKAPGLTADTYVDFNRASIEHTKRLVDYKERMGKEQEAGRLQSLTWPTFFEHTAREGDYFIERLQRLSRGDVGVDPDKAAKFWTLIMGQHAGFIAHLLDPKEQALVDKAMKTSDDFAKLHHRPGAQGKTLRAVEDILDFKVAAEKGIQTGAIRSIIDPALADHVRREAIKAADELRRAA